MHPEPLFRVLPDDFLNDAGVALCIRHHILIHVPCFHDLQFRTYLQKIGPIRLPDGEGRQDRGARAEDQIRQAG